MKVRHGFVSNSSASSFIIGIAIVKDVEKCKKYIEDNEFDKNRDLELFTYKEIKENKRWSVTIDKGKSISVESFDGAVVSVDVKDLKDEDNVLIYSFLGDEGDYCFYDSDNDDNWGELNYDKVYEDGFFNKVEKNIMTMLESEEIAGLEKCSYTIGASRNG